MKKLVVLIVSVVLSALILTACNKPAEVDKIKESISEIAKEVLEGGDDNFTVGIYIGEREQSPQLDGISNAKQPYFLIKVLPKKATTAQSVEYKLSFGDKVYNGVLPKANSNRGFMQDLKKALPYEKVMSLQITCGEVTSTVEVKSVITENMLSSEQAYQKMIEKHGDLLKGMIKDGIFKGEIILRLISDSNAKTKNYFYYIAIIDSDKKMQSMLLNATSGEFVA